jgi:hypothetical protein
MLGLAGKHGVVFANLFKEIIELARRTLADAEVLWQDKVADDQSRDGSRHRKGPPGQTRAHIALQLRHASNEPSETAMYSASGLSAADPLSGETWQHARARLHSARRQQRVAEH